MSITMSLSYMLWYLPLVVAISLVIAATRHERRDLILRYAWQTGVWITGFMVGIGVLLGLASLWI